MGLEKAIMHGKEKRKEYRRSKLFDYSCRNHGGCPVCESNRLYHDRKEDERTSNYKKEAEEWQQRNWW